MEEVRHAGRRQRSPSPSPHLPPGVEVDDEAPPTKRACIAASIETMLSLQVVTLESSSALFRGDDDCAICLQSFRADADDDQDKLRAMPCAHAFHQRCIFQWLRRKAACPLCRHGLPPTQPHRRTRGVSLLASVDGDDYEQDYIAALGDTAIYVNPDTDGLEPEELTDERIRLAGAHVELWKRTRNQDQLPLLHYSE